LNLRQPPNHRHRPTDGAKDIDRAVQAASNAFAGWSRVVPRERGRLLQKIGDAAEARLELARIRTQARPEAKGVTFLCDGDRGICATLRAPRCTFLPWVYTPSATLDNTQLWGIVTKPSPQSSQLTVLRRHFKVVRSVFKA
jgi:hypothetical protein